MIMDRVREWLARHLRQQATAAELAAELSIRRPDGAPRERRKTRRGATHKHRAPGSGRHRRGFLPAVLSLLTGRRMRRPCRFAYARPAKQASRDVRFRVVTNNDRIENALQAARLERKGLRIPVG